MTARGAAPARQADVEAALNRRPVQRVLVTPELVIRGSSVPRPSG